MVLPPGHRGDFPPVNAPKKFLAACYTIEGLNSFATVIYFNYLYFFFRDQFGFDNKHNLALAALIGLIYTLASWQAGKFAQHWGNIAALKIGFGVMIVGFAVGWWLNANWQFDSAASQIAAACVVNVGMCFTWPVLEALVAEGANPARAVGIYNITWAIANASAFFIGGTLIEKFGYRSIFFVPLAFMLLQFALVFWLEKIHVVEIVQETGENFPVREENSVSPARAKNFQRLAWLANPFAYIAINTLIAVLPGIAAKFQLSTSLAGFVCSLWCFARVAAFVALWRWTAWHYKFRWLAGAFGLLIVSFAVILVVPTLAVVLLAQIFFGVAIGLIYYSSLFYSMDASDTKSEHGGIHEAAIGAGNCIGPAVGAAALEFLPQFQNSGVIAVSVLLLCGFGGLISIWKTAK
jgi:predicted MFS family arabinose efflux permease